MQVVNIISKTGIKELSKMQHKPANRTTKQAQSASVSVSKHNNLIKFTDKDTPMKTEGACSTRSACKLAASTTEITTDQHPNFSTIAASTTGQPSKQISVVQLGRQATNKTNTNTESIGGNSSSDVGTKAALRDSCSSQHLMMMVNPQLKRQQMEWRIRERVLKRITYNTQKAARLFHRFI